MPEHIIVGIDEVGRGPLAGPVVAACVYIPDQNLPFLTDATDSKKLSKKRREALDILIRKHCIFSIAEIAPCHIDEINILQATMRAMEKAVSQLPFIPDMIYVDGNRVPSHLPCPAEAIIKGDAKVKQIACASIIAKVYRDAIMERLSNEFPHYGWETNSGYGSKKHLDAIQKYGVTTHHRHSFAPVRKHVQAA
tara:strand:- start:1404 stop:1985 length:582 start_codon:yes stop_codon:yes gene_type:complete